MDASSSPSGLLPQQRVVSMQFRNWKARGMSQSQGPSTQSVCSKLAWLARFAYKPFPLCPSQPSLPGQIWLSGGDLLNICDPTQGCQGLKAMGLCH